MAAISTDVLCECPRHVAEIIAQLVSFEQYSQECLNKSSEDAHLHAYLHGSALSGGRRGRLVAGVGVRGHDAHGLIRVVREVNALQVLGVDCTARKG